MARTLVSSNSPFEDVIGFSRAVRVGNLVAVGGTAPIGPDGRTVAPGDAEAQARRCLDIVEAALAEAGAGLGHVVRTRILLRDIDDWRAVARARADYFREVKPVDTVVQVGRFIDPEWLVEIEVDAVIDEA